MRASSITLVKTIPEWSACPSSHGVRGVQAGDAVAAGPGGCA